MLFTIGLWTVLRAVLFRPATIALENVACATNSGCSSALSADPGLLGGIGSSSRRFCD
jgi:hypothetical protein